MQIHILARQGDISGVAHQLAIGIDINCLDDKYPYRTPLMYAVSSADASVDMVQYLVDSGADINGAEKELNKTVLSLAVQSGDFNKVRLLLDVGADIHYQREHGYDVLIDAMYDGRDMMLILRLLINKGAKVDGVSSYGESALRIASRVGRFDAVKLLLDSGADFNQLEWTDLMYAVVFEDLEAVNALVNSGADLFARDCWGRTPWLLSLQVGDLDKAKLLLSSGSERGERGRCRKTPLVYPIENNNLEILRWLIQEGFDIEETDEFNTTPLMVAAGASSTDCVRLLLESGASTSKVDNCNGKAINRAGDLGIVRMLVAAGEDLSDINDADNDSIRRALMGLTIANSR